MVRDELRYDDVYETIELIVDQLQSCKELLRIRPIFKKHQENFDKILKVNNDFFYEDVIFNGQYYYFSFHFLINLN